ncbi:hypothetical protein, partial [Escherichia fergusonii]|uniref:hypothetical protein n=1 Tax=Escherichia fergusonii TaxID=564 RepID=UPI001CBB291A
MMSIAQVRSAGSAGNYYTDKDNYYVLGSMGERWAGRGAEHECCTLKHNSPKLWIKKWSNRGV